MNDDFIHNIYDIIVRNLGICSMST